MKKIEKLMVIVMIMMTVVNVSYGQSWDNRIFGIWQQTSTFKSNVYSKNISSVNLTSDKKANVTVDNSIIQFDLKSLPNSGLETLLPLEIKNIYGYEAKKVFIRFYNQNNQLRVVRKIYEYDRNGKILNQAQVDSVLFKRYIDKAVLADAVNKPRTPENTTVVNSNPYAGIIKKTVDSNPREDANKKLSSYISFKVKIINMAVINKGDSDGNSNEKFQNKFYFRDAFEVTGVLSCKLDNGSFIVLFENGSNHVKSNLPPYSEVIPLGTPFNIGKEFSYALKGKPFTSGLLEFKVNLYENDMKDYGGDYPGKFQLRTFKDLNVFLSTLDYGDNQILLYSKDGGSLVLNINIIGVTLK